VTKTRYKYLNTKKQSCSLNALKAGCIAFQCRF